jgi:hypothetical protein
VTFAAAAQFLTRQGIPFEGCAPALLAIMEVPAIVMAIGLAGVASMARRSVKVNAGGAAVGRTGVALEFLVTVTCSGGGSLIQKHSAVGRRHGHWRGCRLGGVGRGQAVLHRPLSRRAVPVPAGPWPGGSEPCRRVQEGRSPIDVVRTDHADLARGRRDFNGSGSWTVLWRRRNPGDAGGKASYIVAPAAVRLALPSANPGNYLTCSLAITFPFNIVVGIPLYSALVRLVYG